MHHLTPEAATRHLRHRTASLSPQSFAVLLALSLALFLAASTSAVTAQAVDGPAASQATEKPELMIVVDANQPVTLPDAIIPPTNLLINAVTGEEEAVQIDGNADLSASAVATEPVNTPPTSQAIEELGSTDSPGTMNQATAAPIIHPLPGEHPSFPSSVDDFSVTNTADAHLHRLGAVTITLNSPAYGALFAEQETIELSATVEDPDNEVQFVLFYFVGPQYYIVPGVEGENGEYTAELAGAQPGWYTLDAVAYGEVNLAVTEQNFIDVIGLYGTPSPLYINKGSTSTLTLDTVPIYDIDYITFESHNADIVTVTNTPSYVDPFLYLSGEEVGVTYISAKLNGVEWWTLPVIVYNLSIGVAEGQCGVIGDVAESVLPSGEKHFVTPKGTGTVILEAFIDTNEAGVVFFDDGFEWRYEGTGIYHYRNLIYIPRENTGKYVVEVLDKRTGNVVDKFNVWVIWADMNGEVSAPTVVYTGQDVIPGLPLEATSCSTTVAIYPTATISPSSIITDTDRPNLAGGSVLPLLQGTNNTGDSLSTGVNHRWDISRRVKIISSASPSSLTLPEEDNSIDFPIDPVTGNDDISTSDPEDNDPYSDAPISSPDHSITLYTPIGKLACVDTPTRRGLGNEDLLHGGSIGNVGDTYESKLWFQEFARVQLGVSGQAKWYVISNPLYWRVHYKYRKIALTERTWNVDINGDGDVEDIITEAILGIDTNGDGDTLDNVGIWVDDGTIAADDNE